MIDFVPDYWKPVFGGRQLVPVAPAQPIVKASESLLAGHLIKKVQPQYPDLAKRARLQGDVVFQAIIDKDGTIKELDIEKPLGLGVDESAMDAISKWQYKPYILDGKPVVVRTQITVKYRLRP